MSQEIFPSPNTPSIGSMGPKPATLLYRQLSSAAVDLELAHISRSWDVDEVETYVGQRRSGLSHADALADRVRRGKPQRGKKTFYALRRGSSLKPGHADRLQVLFPSSKISLWFAHPLAEVLCDPWIGADRLLSYLRRLPLGAVSECVWRTPVIQTTGMHSASLLPWSSDLRNRLDRIGTPASLLALLVRLRLEQLFGRADGGLEAAQIAWRMLPRVVARSRHLLVAKDALVLALDYFLSWQPFADARLFELVSVDGPIGRQAAVAECERIWSSDSSIPGHIKLLRRGLARPGLVPWNAGEWSWWNWLQSPASLSEAEDAPH